MKFYRMRNLKIWYKILIIFQVMMIPAIVIFIVLLVITSKMQELHGGNLIQNLASITAAYNVENSLLNIKELKSNYMLDGDKKWLKLFDEKVDQFNFWYNEAFQVVNSEEEKDILSIMSLEFSSYMKAHKKIMDLAESGKKDQAVSLLLIKSMNHFEAIYKGCERLIAGNRNAITESEHKLKRYISISRNLGYLVIFFFIILGVLLVMVITKSIVDPIREIERESEKLLPSSTSKVEIEKLRERFQLMMDTLTANQQKLIVSERRAAIGEIAAGISHELNNPIGIISGFAELLLHKKKLTDEDLEHIKDIHSEAVRCKKLLGDMLDFARTPEPNFMMHNLKNIITETVKLLKNQEKYSGIRFNSACPDDDIEIEIDAVQIKQVLLNILINACDAMNYNGKIDINLSYVDGYSEVKISDTGPGISDEERKKIFTPFYSTKTKGVGLGLAICRDIIEKHNGTIEVGSNTDQGSEFIIAIPRIENEK